jgi:hypothetical protein
MLRVNYVWKGVVLPAGEHEVEFRYYSRTLAWSRVATFLSALIVLGLFARELYGRRGAVRGE